MMRKVIQENRRAISGDAEPRVGIQVLWHDAPAISSRLTINRYRSMKRTAISFANFPSHDAP